MRLERVWQALGQAVNQIKIDLLLPIVWCATAQENMSSTFHSKPHHIHSLFFKPHSAFI